MYKLIGPALIKQDVTEAKANVDKRIEYIEKRLASIRAGEAPDGSMYQDGYGKSRKWSKEEMEGYRSESKSSKTVR